MTRRNHKIKNKMNITFPDGSVKQFEQGVTPLQIAESISPRLAREVLAATVNGEEWDIARPICNDGEIKLFKWEDAEGKHAFWHTSAHLLAEALQELYQGIQFGIGPAIENGFYYDIDPGENQLTQADFEKIEKKMLELAQKKEAVVRSEISKADALEMFGARGETYKCELIADLEDGHISTYTQGAFTDLCRGPHLPNTGSIKAVKILSLAGAYWRGDEKRKQMLRVYGVAFPKKSMLDEYMQMLEEAKKRDHRKIGKEMELFAFSQNVGQGLPLWLPKGAALRDRLEQFLRKIQKRYGYQQVITPHIGNKQLYVTSGHYAKYGKDSFQPIHTPEEGEEYMLKPMNCPHHMMIYANKPHSYRELPIRIGEIAHDFRFEPSGSLKGIERGRHFCQNDAHLFVTPDQIKDEFKRVVDLIFDVYKDFDITNYRCVLSLRDPADTEKYHPDDEMWNTAENALRQVLTDIGIEFTEEIGEAAFYGPKLDVNVQPAVGAEYTLSTCQLDFCLPAKFDLKYVDSDGTEKTPVVLHRAILGSLDRFMAYIIEETKGKFPFWLAPVQIKVLPISEKFIDYANKIADELEAAGYRIEIDTRDEKIGYKIREAQLEKVPFMLIAGQKEEESSTVSVRKRDEGDLGSMTIEDFLKKVQE